VSLNLDRNIRVEMPRDYVCPEGRHCWDNTLDAMNCLIELGILLLSEKHLSCAYYEFLYLQYLKLYKRTISACTAFLQALPGFARDYWIAVVHLGDWCSS